MVPFKATNHFSYLWSWKSFWLRIRVGHCRLAEDCAEQSEEMRGKPGASQTRSGGGACIQQCWEPVVWTGPGERRASEGDATSTTSFQHLPSISWNSPFLSSTLYSEKEMFLGLKPFFLKKKTNPIIPHPSPFLFTGYIVPFYFWLLIPLLNLKIAQKPNINHLYICHGLSLHAGERPKAASVRDLEDKETSQMTLSLLAGDPAHSGNCWISGPIFFSFFKSASAMPRKGHFRYFLESQLSTLEGRMLMSCKDEDAFCSWLGVCLGRSHSHEWELESLHPRWRRKKTSQQAEVLKIPLDSTFALCFSLKLIGVGVGDLSKGNYKSKWR